MRESRQILTTVLGVTSLTYGLLGAIVLGLLMLYNAAYTEPDSHILLHNTASFLPKLGLVVVGVLLLRRSHFVWFVLTCVLVLSSADSAMTLRWFVPPIPEGLSQAARAGRITGHAIAL